MELPFEEMREGLLPESKAYSIVELDTSVPPSDPDAASKLYEKDSIDDLNLSDRMDAIYLAYDEEGNGQIL